MDGGRIVEEGPPEALFARPQSDRLKLFLRAVLDRTPLETPKS
jgi:ABC-type histidine transport system ATPase subunit